MFIYDGMSGADGVGRHTIHNNVLYSAAQIGYGIEVRDILDADIKNNIIVGFDKSIVSSTTETFSEDYNDIYGYGSAATSGFALGAHSIGLNPEFTNAEIGDFALQSASPAIDAGTNLGYTVDFAGNHVYNGSAPDMGAFEHAAISPVPEPPAPPAPVPPKAPDTGLATVLSNPQIILAGGVIITGLLVTIWRVQYRANKERSHP